MQLWIALLVKQQQWMQKLSTAEYNVMFWRKQVGVSFVKFEAKVNQ